MKIIYRSCPYRARSDLTGTDGGENAQGGVRGHTIRGKPPDKDIPYLIEYGGDACE